MKKRWEMPELTVLVRSRTEEVFVAGYCKNNHGTGPSNGHENCTAKSESCGNCSSRNGS